VTVERAAAEEAVESAPARLERHDLIVPLDGSTDARRAIPVARQLADRLGGRLTFVTVVAPGHDRGQATADVEAAAAQEGATCTVVEGRDAAPAIVEAAGTSSVVCMASHGRGRSAAVVGSVAVAVVASSEAPVVVVGPHVTRDHLLVERVVACIDGSPPSEAVLPSAAAWAGALGLALSLVTVAEPVPTPVTPGASYGRRHGPAGDADDYVARLVRRWQATGVPVDGTALYDPVSVAGGLADHLATRPAALVAATTHARRGASRAVLGSVAAAIVRHVPAPVLLERPAS
jgi:nucleotide-binding universal stress UspA family protein